MRKYNPTYHGSVVRNVRDEAKAVGVSTESYSDEEVYNVFDECYLSTEDESREARLEMLKNGEKVVR